MPSHRGLSTSLRHSLSVIESSRLGAAISSDVREQAEQSARALFTACGGDGEALQLAVLGYTADLLGAVAVDLVAHRIDAERLISRLDHELGTRRAALGREILRGGRLLELPVDVATEVTLSLLVTFTGAEAVTLWARVTDGDGDGNGELVLVSQSGGGASARESAREMLGHAGTADHAAAPASAAITVWVHPLDPAPAALVASGVTTGDQSAEALLGASAPLLAALLDRRALLGSEDAPDRVVGAVERRLARLRFDLHDGPQQDIHLLAQDLRLFRDQLRPMIAGDPNQDRVLGRLDDLDAQLVALDGDLRRLATSVQSPFLAPASLPEALRQLTDAFAARTGVVPDTRLHGAVTSLTDSQQIALLSLIRESLTNIRQHSDATSVRITITARDDGVRVEIGDDGSGFDPETTLVRAARAGRLGLVGMHERVRMLGGSTKIDSRPGGPTVISAILPPWSAE